MPVSRFRLSATAGLLLTAGPLAAPAFGAAAGLPRGTAPDASAAVHVQYAASALAAAEERFLAAGHALAPGVTEPAHPMAGLFG